MMRDPWIAASLWCAFIAGIWLVCQLARIGWLYLCALTCWLLEWWDNRREQKALKQHREAHGYSDPARPRVSPTATFTPRHEPPQSLTSSRRAWEGHYTGAQPGRINISASLSQPATGPQSGSHRVSEGGVGNEGAYVGTRLTLGGGDKAA